MRGWLVDRVIIVIEKHSIRLKSLILSAALAVVAVGSLAPTSASALAASTMTTISASASSGPYGSSITFTATVTSGAGTPDGTVILLAGLTSLGTGILNGSGQVSITTNMLPVGVDAVVAVYVGNLNFLTSTSIAVNINISLAACTITVAASANPILFGASVNLTVSVSGSGATPTGNVTLTAGATVLGNVVLDGTGHGVLSVNTLAVGLLSIGASYSGDAHFLGCTAPIVIVTVNQGSTTAAIVSSANPSAAGTVVSFVATISGSGSTPTGAVTFRDGAITIGTATLGGGGQATFATASLAVGSHSITAVYGGDANFAGSTSAALTQTVSQGASTTTVTSSVNPGALGSPITITANVHGAGLLPTGSVTFKDGATTIGTTSLNGSGQAVFVTSALALGTHSISAVYGGDGNFSGSTSAALAQVIVQSVSMTAVTSSANPSMAGLSVSFTATVSGAGGTPTGSVTFKDGVTALGTVALDGTGHATLSTSALSGGSHSITAVYSGNGTFASSTSPVLTQTTNPNGSVTTLSVSPNPANVGVPVTIIGTVTGAGGTPTGTLTFRNNGTLIGSVPLDGSGRSQLTTSALTAGSHSITAVYGGDSNHSASTSAAVALTINGAGSQSPTSLALSSSANPSVLGQPVSFTVRITTAGGSPTGSVTFKDGSNALGTALLAGNAATLTVGSLTVGTHAIVATYVGNATFAASTSPVITQSVNMPPDSVKLRALQVNITKIAAQNSGQAISGAIDAAIEEGFSGGSQMLTPSELGMRLSSAGYDRQVNGNSTAAQRSQDWLVWSDLRHTSWNSDLRSDISGGQVNALAGVTRKITPDLLVGGFAGYEMLSYDMSSLNGHLRGGGWTAGGYLGWRMLSGVRFDAGVAQSGIDYQANAGSAAGSFSGSRTLLTTGITGTYRVGSNLDLEPSAKIYALWESENQYSDSLGVLQPEHNFSTGRASLGAKLIYHWDWSDTVTLAPFVGIYADDYFNKDDAAAALASLDPVEGASMRVLVGLAVTNSSGAKFTSSAEFGGIGSNSFTTWSLRTRAAIPF
jgi:hypothetical protein